MCVLAMAWRASAAWPLVVIANRDELHARASTPLARWDDPAGLIAGRDLMSGGTWLGVRDGRFAAVTNRRSGETPRAHARSRGLLVRDLLAGARPDAAALDGYNPCNLLVVTGQGATFLSTLPSPHAAALGPGLYGLSNGTLDEPWPKTVAIKARLAAWLDGGGAGGLDRLLDALGPEAGQPAGYDGAERSPIFIRDARYGTRCSTAVAVDGEGAGVIAERRFDAGAVVTGETRECFSWPLA